MNEQTLQLSRAAVVRDHMESENHHAFDQTLATFAHPRYELMATGEVFDGEAEVRRYYADTRTAFPDQRNRLLALHAAQDSVIVEFILEGTHRGTLRGLPPTGRAFSTQLSAIFLFAPGTDRIVCERVYFDAGVILRQLGLATDPRSTRGRIETALTHPLTVGRALLGGLRKR